jgi:hypothetical protein
VNIEEFYAQDERRRQSPEVEFGDSWTDSNDPGATYEIAWIEDTGEVYAMREEVSNAVTATPAVQLIGKVAKRAELESLLNGWQDAMRDSNSLNWLRDRLQHGITLEGMLDHPGSREGERVVAGAEQPSDDPRFIELDKLSSEELHDRAVHRAEQHLDLKFFWDLLKEIPAAEAASGNLDAAEKDIISVSREVRDSMGTDKGRLAEAFRPIYIDYLLRHEEASG